MEPGETVEQTALREIVEETGIEGAIIRPVKTRSNINIIMKQRVLSIKKSTIT